MRSLGSSSSGAYSDCAAEGSVVKACVTGVLSVAAGAAVVLLSPLKAQQARSGGEIFEAVKARYGTVASTRWTESLSRVASDLSAVSSPTGDTYTTAVTQQPGEFNAFALEGGYIVFTSGCLEMFDALLKRRGYTRGTEEYTERFDNLVAGLLSHEIGHVLLGHHERSRQARAELRGDSLALRRQAYERKLEYEADRIGALLMVRAGYDLDGLYSVYQIADALVESPHSLENLTYVRSHPRPSDREANLDIWKGQLKRNQARVDDAVTLIQNNTMLDVSVALLDSVLVHFPSMLTLRHNRATAWHRIWLNSRPVDRGTPMGAFALYAPDILSMLRAESENQQALRNAIEDYRFVLDRSSNPATVSQLATLMAAAGDVEMARQMAEQAIGAAPENPVVTANAAAVDLYAGRPESAYRRVQGIFATLESGEGSVGRSAAASALYNFGLAAEQLGRSSEAQQAYALYASRVDSTSRFARMAQAKRGAARSSGLPFADRGGNGIAVSGLRPGVEAEAVTETLGEPEFVLGAGDVRSFGYPSSGLSVLVEAGISSLVIVRKGYEGAVGGIRIGDSVKEVREHLGPPRSVTEAGWHDYLASGLSVRTIDDRVTEIVVSG